jgi:hypothetical protein
MNNMNANQNNMYNNNINLNNQGNIGINNNQNQNLNNYQSNNQGNIIQNNINNIQNNINNNNINQINSQFNNNNIIPNNNIMNNKINQNQNACNMDISNIETIIQTDIRQNNAAQSDFNNNNNNFQNKDNNIVYNENSQDVPMKQNKNELNLSKNKSSGQISSSNILKIEKSESKLSSSDSGIKNRRLNKHIPKQIDETIYFKEESKNQIVDRNEMNIIRNIIEILYSSCNDQSSDTLSELICDQIKKKLGGEWFVMAQGQDEKLSFNISSVSNTNIIKIRIGESRIHIGKLK